MRDALKTMSATVEVWDKSNSHKLQYAYNLSAIKTNLQ